MTLTPKEKRYLKMRLKYGPALSRNECVHFLLRISAGKVGIPQDDGKAPEGHSQPSKVDSGWGGYVEGCQGQTHEREHHEN